MSRANKAKSGGSVAKRKVVQLATDAPTSNKPVRKARIGTMTARDATIFGIIFGGPDNPGPSETQSDEAGKSLRMGD